VKRILEHLPADLEWTVVFRAATLRRFVDDGTFRAMFFLSAELSLEDVSHVVLSARGRAVARGEEIVGVGDTPLQLGGGGPDLASAFASELGHLRLERCDCVGIGRRPGDAPAILGLEIGAEGRGEAVAVLQRVPETGDYDLLRAAGVEFLGTTQDGPRVLARFGHRLPTHVHAGALAGFTRTHHCNQFFFNHCTLDVDLRSGLQQAGRDRLEAGRRAVAAAAAELTRLATKRALPMTCEPPPPEAPFAYGDVVPLGFLLRGMRLGPSPAGALAALTHRLLAEELADTLRGARQGDLWAFHRGRLVTCTDSALVLLGLQDADGVAALERFRQPDGGYLPQLDAPQDADGSMRAAPENAHWRQADFATTLLVAGLRGEAGLAPATPLAWIAERLDGRSGLFFADPWLVDWCTAMGLAAYGPQAAPLRERLEAEVLGSVNDDGSFGHHDRPLSTALAILALGALGHRSRAIRSAQLRLLEALHPPRPWPATRPFYSTFVSPGGGADAPAHVRVAGQVHEVSTYRDEPRTVLAGLVALALAVECDPDLPDAAFRAGRRPHPRYRCATAFDYLAAHALPPYVAASVSRA
jgi:hypothetical protein